MGLGLAGDPRLLRRRRRRPGGLGAADSCARAAPLVDLRQLRHRAVLGADVAAILLGIALYMFLTVVTEFVQTPCAEGFGFGATTLVAGLCLVPFSITSLAPAG